MSAGLLTALTALATSLASLITWYIHSKTKH